MKTETLVFYFIIIHVIAVSDNEHCDSDCSECPKQCIEFDPSAPSVIVQDNPGRLGNLMSTYQLLLGIKLKFGFQVYMTRNISQIKQYFPKVDKFIPVAEEKLCDFERIISKYW